MFSLSLWLKVFNLLSICCTFLGKTLLEIIEYILNAIDTNLGQNKTHFIKLHKAVCIFVFCFFIICTMADLKNFMNVSEKDGIVIYLFDNEIYSNEVDNDSQNKISVYYITNNYNIQVQL